MHWRKRIEENRPRFRSPRWLLIVLARRRCSSVIWQRVQGCGWMRSSRSRSRPGTAWSIRCGMQTPRSGTTCKRAMLCTRRHGVDTWNMIHLPRVRARVMRAVTLSDTNPPLYYLLLVRLDACSRYNRSWPAHVFGPGDARVLPTAWRVGHAIGGRDMTVFACLLFAFAPTVLALSAEARMYR